MNVIATHHFNAPILLADDNAAETGRMEGVLRNVGYRHIRTTNDLEEVTNLHEKWPFSLLVVNVAPGATTAFDVIARLHQTTDRHPPAVLAILEGDDNRGRDRVVGLAVRDFIIKPYTWPELVRRVGTALEIWHIGSATDAAASGAISPNA